MSWRYGNNTKYHAVDKDNKEAQKERPCLNCKRKFPSMNKYNRVCGVCKASDAFKLAQEYEEFAVAM